MNSVYRGFGGWEESWVGGGGGWGAEGGFFHTLEQKSNHCVLIEALKHAQLTYQLLTLD